MSCVSLLGFRGKGEAHGKEDGAGKRLGEDGLCLVHLSGLQGFRRSLVIYCMCALDPVGMAGRACSSLCLMALGADITGSRALAQPGNIACPQSAGI